MLLARLQEAFKPLYAEAPAAIEPEPEQVTPTEEAAEPEAPASEEAAPSEAQAPAADPMLTDYQTKGYHLDIAISPDQVVTAAEILDREGFFIEAVTGVDLLTIDKAAKKKPAKKDDEAAEEPAPEPGPPQMEVVYDFNHFDELCRVVVRSRIPRDNPEIPTISHIFQGADWHERETHDFFGIVFTGHPDLSPLLLPEDADFHPLCKDFSL